MKLIYVSLPKELHFAKDFIIKYVIERKHAPLNPFNHSYWLLDTVDRDLIRDVCNYYTKISNEVWVFNYKLEIESNGVIREIEIAYKHKIPVKYFLIDKDTQEIRPAPDMYF